MIQVSMDGPIVNWTFFRELSTDLVTDEEDPELLSVEAVFFMLFMVLFSLATRNQNGM